jgi:hypothetical protein
VQLQSELIDFSHELFKKRPADFATKQLLGTAFSKPELPRDWWYFPQETTF